MTDPRSLLERESQRFTQTDGAFERLLSRRGRRQRNRRIRAGAVGVLVALAAAAFLVRSIASEHVPANPTPSKPLGAGEVLTGRESDLLAQDPDSREVRTIVDAAALPGG